MKPAAIILAAGESRRMGRPKALLPYRGETFLDSLIAVLSSACSPVIVVLGHEPERIREGAGRAAQARFIVNEDYRKGQLTSLQCGLRAAPAGVEAVLFTPVDYPAVTRGTVERLAAALRETGAPVVVPRYNGRRGHPVGVTRPVIADLLALPETSSAREVIHARLGEAVQLDVDDSGVCLDVDEPETYRRLLDEAGEGTK